MPIITSSIIEDSVQVDGKRSEMEYIFRIEKRSPEHPLTPQVLVEFGCNAENPRAMLEAVVAFGELLKICGTPEKVVEYMKHSAGVQRVNLFVNEVFG